ncbi:MAG: hypothetical protein MZW92_18440 [Comamonadaceae bacterium]|nr:hypothetical protein [Comamonadaceae bacterium]
MDLSFTLQLALILVCLFYGAPARAAWRSGCSAASASSSLVFVVRPASPASRRST